MATVLAARTPRLLAALLVTGALLQVQPALSMEVTINEVQSSIRTTDGGGGGYMGGIVRAVVNALGEEAARAARQRGGKPQQPQ